MMARLYTMILPVFEEEDHLRLAGLLRVVTLALGALAAIYMLLAIILRGFRTGAILAFIILALAFAVYWIVRKGRSRAGGFILVSGFWVIVTLPSLVNPGQPSYSFTVSSYMLPILLAGVFFGGWAAAITAILSSFSTLLLSIPLFTNAGLENPVASLILNWASQSIIFFIAAILLALASHSVQEALGRARSGERNLTERNRQLMREVANRLEAEKELKAREESSRQFQQHLKALHEVNRELSSLGTLEEIYANAVKMGREQLGFDRMAVFLLDEESNTMVGTFGTDPDGQIRDERSLKSKLNIDDLWVTESLHSKMRVSIKMDTPLTDNWQVVGHGWNAMAGLWNGTKGIGWLAADNLINQLPLQEHQLELLSLYGSMLGHLLAQKQAEEALRISEETALQFQQRLKVLYEVTIQLAKTTTLEEMYREAVELGRSRLQFDRIGLFMKEEKTNMLVGAFGTDTNGSTTDEHSTRVSLLDDTWAREIYAKIDQQHIRIRHDTQLYYQLAVVGTGWHVIAPLWNGEKVVGWISLDNLIHQKPLLDYEIEIITLYGSMLGHLSVQKIAEQELLQSQEQLRLALQAAQMRTWDWDFETDIISRYASQVWVPPYTTYQEFLKHIHPDDRDRTFQAVQRAIAQNTTYAAEYRFEHPEKDWGWLYTVGQVYRDSSGKPIGMAGVSQDITERKRAEEALKLSEERFYKAFHANPSAISITTASEGRYIDVNESWLELFGYTRGECIGQTSLGLNTWIDPEDDINLVKQLDREGTLYGVESARRTKSGSVVHVLLYAEKIEIAGESYYLTMMQDISARKAAEKQALELALEKERVELLREFVGNISHDLKTPLTVINNSLYLLERLTDPSKQQENLNLISMQTQILDRYIQDILTISRLDYAPEISLKRIYVESTLRSIEQRMRPSIEKNNLTVNLDLDNDIPPIMGDESELDRALVNLVENALNYTPSDGVINIRAYTQEAGVVIEVSDTGIGMNESDIPHIFDRFYRSDQARSALKSGTGLGLAIVKRIVDMHHGTIRVESQMGKGSTFQVWLPAIQEMVH